ncbi:vWA domain-containing protein [Paenibacillus sp. UMB4589-SE434]|uniref:vWA domain-containing protein n=1 Tax=Paenibacillus sp. UMB4589-SE434 TaxID=3046314 RepID=UPI00254B9DFE|nr:vWA domain-containing protein [Paenibacillus sp. UMB4589-SE434]MDK8184114.1 vWA domain-containing protein [Paenibacillus sp. UMB4589-SE434]
MLRQILLITDGCSNVGVQPAVAAAQARDAGIAVNVVGIVDEGTIGEYGAAEITDIARAGGGISRIVNQRQLAQTMQMMTRKTVVQTIHQAVNHELKHILGCEEESIRVEVLPPEQRAEVVRVMDEMGEETPLRVALLIDTSASMKPKLPAVEDAIHDLMLSLQARRGKSELSVFHFPGSHGNEHAVMDMDWAADMNRVRRLFQRLNIRGTTPTGPALLHVVDFYQYDSRARAENIPYYSSSSNREGTGTDGVWSDYIV